MPEKVHFFRINLAEREPGVSSYIILCHFLSVHLSYSIVFTLEVEGSTLKLLIVNKNKIKNSGLIIFQFSYI